jgi:hypothetical protein
MGIKRSTKHVHCFKESKFSYFVTESHIALTCVGLQVGKNMALAVMGAN